MGAEAGRRFSGTRGVLIPRAELPMGYRCSPLPRSVATDCAGSRRMMALTLLTSPPSELTLIETMGLNEAQTGATASLQLLYLLTGCEYTKRNRNAK